MRELRRLSIAILLMSALVWAGEPWESKPYDKWNKNDVERVLDHSPWATLISVHQTWGIQIRETTSVVTVPASEAAVLQSRRDIPTGAIAAAPEVPFEARWISARTMREALARQLLLAGQMTQADAQQFLSQASPEYQIDVFGPNMAPFSELDEATLAKASFLRFDEAKATLAPISVTFLRGTDGKAVTGVIFSFPEVTDGKQTIPEGEKGLDFICKTKVVTLSFHFDPRKMMVKQQRDL